MARGLTAILGGLPTVVKTLNDAGIYNTAVLKIPENYSLDVSPGQTPGVIKTVYVDPASFSKTSLVQGLGQFAQTAVSNFLAPGSGVATFAEQGIKELVTKELPPLLKNLLPKGGLPPWASGTTSQAAFLRFLALLGHQPQTLVPGLVTSGISLLTSALPLPPMIQRLMALRR